MKSIYENLRLRHEIRYLASVEIEHELRARDGAVAFADRQFNFRRHVVLDGMSYIGDKLRDLGKYGAIAEHLYFRVCKRHVAKHIVANLFVQIIIRIDGLLLLLCLVHLRKILTGFVYIDLVYIDLIYIDCIYAFA